MANIDIAITTFNRADLLERAITSVLAQTDQSFTLYVLDNQSTDNTEQLCKKLLPAPHQYIRNAENFGMTGNWNQALKTGDAQYLNILHDDDELHPDFVAKVREFIQSNPECALIHTGTDNIDQNSQVIGGKAQAIPSIVTGNDYFAAWLSQKMDFVCPTVIYNREKIPVDLQFADELPFTADLVFFLQASAFGSVGYIRDRIFRYRVHDGSTTSTLRDKIGAKIADRRFAGKSIQRESDNRSLVVERSERVGSTYMYNSLAADILFTRLLGGSLTDVLYVARQVTKAEPSLWARARFYRMFLTALFPPKMLRAVGKLSVKMLSSLRATKSGASKPTAR